MQNLREFLNECQNLSLTGSTTEHSYRRPLENLLNSIDEKYKAINEPKRTEVGAPDFIIIKNGIQVAFLEAKDIDKNLEDKTYKDQIHRYQNLGNLCFTNNLDWKFYEGENLVCEVSIGKLEQGKILIYEENLQILSNYLDEFVHKKASTITSSKGLATTMAKKALLMKYVFEKSLSNSINLDNQSTLRQEYESFKKLLVHDLKVSDFADIYAQTVTYGFFTARFYDDSLDTFSRYEAAEKLPKSNPFLRNLFHQIAGFNTDDEIVWIIDNLVEIFSHTDVKKLMEGFGNRTSMKDPVLHFYETFLSEYNPEARKKMGVYYTPDPVVKFIVKSVDEILKRDFGIKDGLADNSKVQQSILKNDALNRNDIIKEQKGNHTRYFKEYHKVQVLDPATGTGTFLLEVFNLIYKKFENNQGIWKSYAKNDLVPRIHGFELLMASYTMAHLKLAMFLSDTGVELDASQRLSVYLTNSLEESIDQGFDLFSRWLTEESEEASKIKNENPVMVIVGNPPYSGESKNKSDFIMKLMDDYKKEPGGKIKLKERNPKWINDDYVKFIRYSQSLIEKNGEGIIAFINPHGFLDNPTFRGVRWNLLNTFDDLYIIDLHGNSKKNEVSPDGTLDINVFDIEQGVSINIFVKTGMKEDGELGRVYHKDMYGSRVSKYEYLLSHSVSTVDYKLLPNKAPSYFMVQKDFEFESEYDKGVSIADLFKVSSVGIVTSRDSFAIDESKAKLDQRIKKFFNLDREVLLNEYALKENKSWKINSVKESAKEFNEEHIRKINYRPFDSRHIYYEDNFIERSRGQVMKQMVDGYNLGLCLCKQFKSGETYQHVLVTDKIIESSLVSNKTSEITSIFPLILDQGNTLEIDSSSFNLCNEEIKLIEDQLKMTCDWDATINISYKDQKKDKFSPVDLLDYIYGVLHSPNYRSKYKEFLKINFPRIPFDVNQAEFWQFVEYGSKLRELHLMTAENSSQVAYPIEGDNIVEKTSFKDGKVYINSSQYFDNVPDIAWNFYIGGYQPAQKWLKDRKSRELEYNDILHYQKIISILSETDRLMKEINEIKIF